MKKQSRMCRQVTDRCAPSLPFTWLSYSVRISFSFLNFTVPDMMVLMIHPEGLSAVRNLG